MRSHSFSVTDVHKRRRRHLRHVPFLLQALTFATLVTLSGLSAAQQHAAPTEAARATSDDVPTTASPWWQRADELVAVTLGNHPRLDAATARREAQDRRADAAASDRPATQLGVMGGILPVETREGPIFAQLSVTQPLPNFAARRASVERTDARAAQLACDQALTALDLQQGVASALADFDAAALSETIVERYLALSDSLRRILEREAAYIDDPALALYRAALLEDNLQRQRARLEGERRAARARVLSFLGEENDETGREYDDLLQAAHESAFFAAAAQSADAMRTLLADETLFEDLLAQAPELQRIDAQRLESLASAQEAGAARRVRWALQATWSSVGVRELAGDMRTEGGDALSVGVMMTLPTTSANRHQREAAILEADASVSTNDAFLRERRAALRGALATSIATGEALHHLEATTLPALRSLESQLVSRAAQGLASYSAIADAALEGLAAELDAVELALRSLQSLIDANRLSAGQLLGEGIVSCESDGGYAGLNPGREVQR